MSDPVIAKREPIGIELAPGTYWWCACGRSSNQPFCDGSHKDTGVTPVEFTVAEKSKLWFCRCKHTKTVPYCDGSHSKLEGFKSQGAG